MILTAVEAGALRKLLHRLLSEEEAEAVYYRHLTTPVMPWEEIAGRMGRHPLRVDRLYRRALVRLRGEGRLLSALLLEAPACDR